MSEPGYVVMPIQATGARSSSNQGALNAVPTLQQSFGQSTSSSIGENYQGLGNQGQRRQGFGGLDNQTSSAGPLKKAIANQDSLYMYFSWENPLRTIGSYLGALGFLFGIHYFPLTQIVLKVGATLLGVMSVATFASQSFSTQTASRPQPRQYKRVPEDTLNATLRDVHDFVQYAVVEVQRIIFGEHLTKTFAGFIGLTTLYWLIKILPAFWLSVVGLTSLYVGTLVLSPRGREVTREAGQRAGELANTAAESGKAIAWDAKTKAVNLSSQTQDAAANLSSRTQDAAANLSSQAQTTASNASRRTGDAVQNRKRTVADQSNRALGTASDDYKSASKTKQSLPEVNNDDTIREINATRSSLNETRQHSNTSTSRLGNSLGNSGLGSTSSGFEISGTAADAAAARAYLNNPTIETPNEYTHAPDYGAIGGGFQGHDSINTETASRLNTTRSPLDASKQPGSIPRYNTVDGNYDSRFDAVAGNNTAASAYPDVSVNKTDN